MVSIEEIILSIAPEAGSVLVAIVELFEIGVLVSTGADEMDKGESCITCGLFSTESSKKKLSLDVVISSSFTLLAAKVNDDVSLLELLVFRSGRFLLVRSFTSGGESIIGGFHGINKWF